MTGWNDPSSDPLADIEAFMDAVTSQPARPNTITMSRRVWWLIITAGMTKRQRRRVRGRMKGQLRLWIARGRPE